MNSLRNRFDVSAKRFSPPSRSISASTRLLLMVAALLIGAQTALAQTTTILTSFAGGSSDGKYAQSRLVEDSSGNLYGTTSGGGSYNKGTVFELSPPVSPHTTWTKKVLYSFGGPLDGAEPLSGLAIDSGGNLYGLTYVGGVGGYGTFYELSNVAGVWGETELYSFGSYSGDGTYPYDPEGPVLDLSGNVYVTTQQGGAHAEGAVIKITPGNPGSEEVLYSFKGGSTDGNRPMGGLVLSGGDLYGTTYLGGSNSGGIAFKLSPGSPSWTETILHNFGGTLDGNTIYSGLAMDSSGNLYGTTYQGGTNAYGTVFKITAAGAEAVIWNFGGTGDGKSAASGLVIDSSGNLYGTTQYGGANRNGTVFEVSPSGLGFAETVLHSFSGSTTDGGDPFYGPLIMDSSGNLYGGTPYGGSSNLGVVFKVVP